MKFIAVLFIFLIILFIPSYAQIDSVSLKRIYEKEVIYFSGFNGNKYIKNNTLYPIKNLKNEFKMNSDGYLEFTMYQKDYKKGLILFTVGSAGLIAGLLLMPNNPNEGVGLFAISSIPYFVSIPFTLRARKRVQKAVWLRNRDVLTSNMY